MKTILFAAMVLVCGCSDAAPSASDDSPKNNATANPDSAKGSVFPLKVVDDASREVLISAPPKRILSLAPSNTELVFAVGAGGLLVGRTSQCDHPPKVMNVPSVGSLFPPDYERIVGTRPDLVLMVAGNNDVRTRLESRGLTVLVLQPKQVSAVADAMKLLGRVLGRETPVKAIVSSFQDGLAAELVSKPAKPIRVFYEVWPDPLTAAGPSSFVGDLITAAGGHNVVEATDAWPRPSAEHIIAANPEIIIVSREVDRIALIEGKRAGWASLTAVEKGHVFVASDPSILVRPGPRLLEGLRWLKARFAESRR